LFLFPFCGRPSDQAKEFSGKFFGTFVILMSQKVTTSFWFSFWTDAIVFLKIISNIATLERS